MGKMATVHQKELIGNQNSHFRLGSKAAIGNRFVARRFCAITSRQLNFTTP
jgi:hypothetical protein